MTVYCRDCKHRIPYEKGKVTKFDVCGRSPKEIPSDYLVLGIEVPLYNKYTYCSIERDKQPYSGCGREGKLFEQLEIKESA
jgi:hypothetical protein